MIDDPELLQFLQSEEAQADDPELTEQRATAIEFFFGELFGNEIEGRSQVRTRDVAKGCNSMLVSILKTFVAGGRIVEFEPTQPIFVPGEPDAQGNPTQKDISQEVADEATARIQWSFMSEQDGYSLLHDWLKAGLIEKTGVLKSYIERPMVPERVRVNARDLEADDAGFSDVVPLEEMYDVLPVTGEDGQELVDEFGEPVLEPVQVYDAVRMVEGPPRMRDDAIPNEQFFCSPDTRALFKTPYCGDWSRQSIADLMTMGYRYEDLEGLWSDTGSGKELSDVRDSKRGGRDDEPVRKDLHRTVVLREEYCNWYYRGRYQMVRVHRVHSTILSVEPVERHPYTMWCPYPMQHRLVGQSLADNIMDIQVARSTALRQVMDAANLSNAPRMYIDMSQADDTTLDDVLDVAPGGIVRGKGPSAVTPLTQPFVASSSFDIIGLMESEQESRTGITKLNQGLDDDTINQTASGQAQLIGRGEQIEEYVARNAANALGEVFEKKLRLMMVEMPPHQFKIGDEWREVDPSQWPTDMRLNVRVGLGTGSKDKKLQDIAILKQTQAEAMQVDPRLVGPERAYETAKLTATTLDLQVSQYFNDPATLPAQEPQPDPAVVQAQLDAQQKQAEFQANQQLQMAKLEMEREDRAARLQLDRQVREAELALASQNAERDYNLQMQKIIMQADANASMAMNRAGGSLNA